MMAAFIDTRPVPGILTFAPPRANVAAGHGPFAADQPTPRPLARWRRDANGGLVCHWQRTATETDPSP